MTPATIDDRIENVKQALMAEALDRGWGMMYAKFGKEGKQSLFVHSVNVASVVDILSRELFDLSDDDRFVAFVAGFLHDYQKSNESWQRAAINFMHGARNPNASFDHDDGSPEELKRLEQLLSGVERRLSEEGTHENLRELAPRILNIIVYTHDSRNRAVATRRRNQVGPIDPLA
ncbi:MAG: hypothetical protein ACTSYX_10905, partial [Candidatus Thorarchaeota archaeon]